MRQAFMPASRGIASYAPAPPQHVHRHISSYWTHRPSSSVQVTEHYKGILDGETAVVVIADQVDSFYQFADGKEIKQQAYGEVRFTPQSSVTQIMLRAVAARYCVPRCSL